jgi:glycosyltransferase involved in cell wall biosynthesis
MVAGFRKEKRHIDAIRAFTILQKKCKNVFLICVGDNRVYERDSLQEFINKQGIKNIKLVLAPDAGDIKNFYWSANLFTLTSNKVETFPISSLEAMACGVPCVLTDTGGASNILTTSYLGLTAPIENPEAIAKAWETVLMQKRYQNKQRIRSLVVSKYSIKESASHYLKLLSGRSC